MLRMKKMLAFVLAATMMMGALAGCTSEPADSSTGDSDNSTSQTTEEGSTEETPVEDTAAGGKVLNWNLGADPKTIDPGLNSAVDGSHVITNTFEGLYRNKGNGELEPAMAESYTVSDDGLVYTFTLRDAKWSDGEPVTANDFVFAWRRVVDPATASEYGYIMAPIKNATAITASEMAVEELGVKAIDDKTLEVTMEYPCGYFLDLTGFPTLMPLREDVVGDDTEGTWAKDPSKVVCNGPYKVTEYVMGDHLTLSKNENYWNAENVKIDTVNARMIVEESTSLAAFNAGELDFTTAIPRDEIPQMIASGEVELLPYISTTFYVINTQTEALSDVRVRKALSMAIDRTALCEQVTRAGEIPAAGIVPPGFTDADGNDFNETAGDYGVSPTADVEGAKALLAEAGYPNGEGLPELEIMYNTNENNKAIAEAVQAMWKEIGVNVVLNNQEWAVFQDTRMNLQYNGIARHAWTGDYQDPQTFLDMFMTGNVQSGNGYASDEYTELVEKGMAASGKERFDAFYAAEQVLMDDGYFIPLFYATQPVLASEDFTGWYLSSTGKLWLGDADIAA